jgi:glutathione transport system substrate-binding protein
MRMANVKWMTLLLGICMALTACGGNDTNTSTEKTAAQTGKSISQQKDITTAITLDFTSMDPMDTNDTLSGGIQRMVMDGLFSFDDQMNIIPMLATGYTANDTATEFTIPLRKGIKFTDGTAWNADAAIANIHKWMDKSLGLKRTTFLSPVIQEVQKLDDYTIKIILNKPFGALINNLAHPCCVMMSPKQIEQGPAVCAKSPVGTGQYKFKEWTPGDHLKLELNKDWWGYNAEICGGKAIAEKDAGFKTITFKPVPEDATRVAMLQSGDAQIIWPVPTENIETLKSDSRVHVFQEEGIYVRFLTMNTQKKPYTDLKVRQAINYAIDKDAYIKVVKNGMGSVATSIAGPKVQFYKKNEPIKYDPEKAKELLKEAGYPNGFTTTMLYASTSANQKEVEFVKQQLEKVGIHVELKGMENALLSQKILGAKVPGNEAEVELRPSGWSSSTGDADWAIRPLLAKESEPPMCFNLCYFENAELDGYLQAGLQTADPNARREAYAKAQDLIARELPVVLLENDFNTWATSSTISNVKLYPDGGANMKNARMAE